MKKIPLAVLLLLLLVQTGRAQGRSSPGVPTGREGDRVRMSPRGDGAAKPKNPEEAQDEPERRVRDPLDDVLSGLETWPSAEAREAAALLALRGPELEPILIEALQTASPRLSAGICFVLGDIGGDASLSMVQRVAARPSMSEYLTILFEAMAKLDGVNAVTRVLPFLRHRRRSARLATERWLRGRLNASHAPRLESLLTERDRGARTSALQLLQTAAPDRAVHHARELLGDEAPEIARLCAEILADAGGPEIVKFLNSSVGSPQLRMSAYATLAMVMIEDRGGERPYTAGTVRELLGPRGLSSEVKLNQAASAIALADIGYDSEVAGVDEVLDTLVTLALLNAIGGPTFYKDFPSIAPLARDRFGKLTGIRDRRPIPELWAWWLARPEALGKGFVLLFREDALSLARLVLDRLLSLPDAGAVDPERVFGSSDDSGFGPEAVITVSLRNRSRTVIGRKDQVPDEVRAVLERLITLREEYAWQTYWDRDTYPRYEEFIRAQLEFFETKPTSEERAGHLKRLIVAALDDLTSVTERTSALDLLLSLDATLTDSEAFRIAKLLEQEEESDSPVADRLFRVLARTAKPLILPMLADWAERHASPWSRARFVEALSAVGPEEVNRASLSKRPFLRRASMTASVGLLDESALASVLRRGMQDDEPGVRRAALLAIGEAAPDGASKALAAAVEDPEQDVSLAAIEALGVLGTTEAVNVLVKIGQKRDLARRVAAVRALCVSALDEALAPVLVALRDDESPLVRGTAAREIVTFGERALKGLSRTVMDPKAEPAVRAQAMEALARIGGDHVVPVLEALLDDRSEEVADAAAFALAGRARKTAVPRLLEILEAGRSLPRTVGALERVSCQTFSSARAEELPAIYRGWWAEKQGESARSFFASALERRGYEKEGALGLLEQNPNDDVIRVLLRALADPAWFIRANANLWLSRLTAEDFGSVSRFTAEQEHREIVAKWKAWWEAR